MPGSRPPTGQLCDGSRVDQEEQRRRRHLEPSVHLDDRATVSFVQGQHPKERGLQPHDVRALPLSLLLELHGQVRLGPQGRHRRLRQPQVQRRLHRGRRVQRLGRRAQALRVLFEPLQQPPSQRPARGAPARRGATAREGARRPLRHAVDRVPVLCHRRAAAAAQPPDPQELVHVWVLSIHHGAVRQQGHFREHST